MEYIPLHCHYSFLLKEQFQDTGKSKIHHGQKDCYDGRHYYDYHCTLFKIVLCGPAYGFHLGTHIAEKATYFCKFHYFTKYLFGLAPQIKMWQDRQESNPQPPVLETDALPIELLSCNIIYYSLLPLLMICVFPAGGAIFFQLHPIRVLAFVASSRIVTILTIFAS